MIHQTLLLLLLGLYTTPSHATSRQYHFIKDLKKTWTDAQSYCRETYTDLATIDNMNDMEKLKSAGSIKNYWQRGWIGLYDDINSWRWSLAEGEAGFRNWDTSQPDNHRSGELEENGDWNDKKCNENHFFTCYHAGANSSSRFVLIREKLTWVEAQRFCREHHTDLVSVRNQTENQQIQALAMDQPVWIGLFRDGWRWSAGSSSSFRHWKSREPNNFRGIMEWNNENCVEVISSTGEWNDNQCTYKRSFFCHHEETTATTDPTHITGSPPTSTPTSPIGQSTSSPTPTFPIGQSTSSPSPTSPIGQSTSSPSSTSPIGQSTSSPSPTSPIGQSTSSPTPTSPIGQSTSSPSPTSPIGQSTSSPSPTSPIGQSTSSPSPTSPIGQSTSPSLSSTEGKLASFLSSTASSSSHHDYVKFFHESKSWVNALRFCEGRNSTLVHITNESVQGHVTQLLANEDLPQGVWIGLERSIYQWNAPWVWTGGPVVAFNRWHDCFPRCPPELHCGQMVRVSNELKWLDACCHEELPFICQDLNH